MFLWCLKSLVRWHADGFSAVEDRQGTLIHMPDRKLAGPQRPEKCGKREGSGDQSDSDNDNGNREQGHEERCVLSSENIMKNIQRNKH